MRIRLVVLFLAISAAAHASSTLRIGNQVLTAGDSQERVIELLGKPVSKTHKRASRKHRGAVRVISSEEGGEQWRYHRDDHVTVVTIVAGRVSRIEDHRL
ncbi:MAG: DUF2845 domain-containing protein [Rhodanobacter sp.]